MSFDDRRSTAEKIADLKHHLAQHEREALRLREQIKQLEGQK